MLKRRFSLIAAGLFLCGCWYVYNWMENNQIITLIKTFSLVKKEYLHQVSTAALVEGAIGGMVNSLGDPYSVYLDEDLYRELNEQTEGLFGGIGIEIDLNKEEQLVVVAPLPGTPAEKAGVESGDIIVEIAGKSTDEMDTLEAAKLLRGEPGTEVSFKVWREKEEKKLEFRVFRKEIHIPSVTGKMLPGEQKVGYLKIHTFNQTSTISQLQKELDSLKDKDFQSLILDLRGNPGGELYAAVELAGYFIPQGPVVRIVHRGGNEDVLRPASQRQVTLPLVVLVDQGSASASEIVAGAIKDTETGVLIGTKTFGKGIVQTVFDLNGRVGLKLTTDRYLTPKGIDIHGKGIEPDIIVEQGNEEERDLQLEKAVEVLLDLQNPQKEAA